MILINKKINTFLILTLLMLGSCNSGQEEIPINPESFTMTDLMGMSLDYLAYDLRNNGRTFQDVEFVNQSSIRFLERGFSGNIKENALLAYHGFLNESSIANFENGNSLPVEIESLLDEIDILNDDSESMNDFISSLINLKGNFILEPNSDLVRNEGVLLIEMNLILVEFYNINNDLFDTLGGNEVEQIQGWWSRARGYLKCAAGIVGGSLTGAVGGCGVGGGVGFAVGGPVGAGVGCAIGAVVGGIAGGLTGAVVSGCFEL